MKPAYIIVEDGEYSMRQDFVVDTADLISDARKKLQYLDKPHYGRQGKLSIYKYVE